MRFGFVTKREYDIEKENAVKINEQRIKTCQENKVYQLRIKELEKEVKLLQEELEAYKVSKVEKVVKTTKSKSTVKKNTKKTIDKKESK